MSNSSDLINKPLVGVLALLCLGIALGTWIFSPDQQGVYAAFTRVGAVLAALWMALPKPGEQVRWAKLSPYIVAAAVLMVLTKKLIILAVPLLMVLGFLELMLRPRPKRRPDSRSA
jgi:hypothetical protein